MATHNMYCVGLKRKVDATVEGVTHMITSKGSKYQIKGHYMDGDKKYNCTSMCSKALYDSMKASGVTAATKDRTIVLDAEPKLGSGKRFKELSDEIAEEYEEKGKSPEEAKAIGDATAASIGIKKYGKKEMAKLAHDAEGDEAVPEDSEGDGVETPEEVTDIEEEADVEQPEVDDAYTEESGEEPAPSVVEASAVSATTDAPEGSSPLEYDPTSETPMDAGGPAASYESEHESAYDKLEDEIADEYEEKGMSDEEAERIGAATAYKVGVDKYGKKVMEEAARRGVPADSLDAEGLEPQTAFGGYLASLEDLDGVESVVVEAPLGHGVTQYYAEDGEAVVPDPSSFPEGSGHVIGSQVPHANYTPLHAEDATASDYDPLAELPGPVLDDGGPSDTFEAMEVYKSGPADVQKGMAAILNAVNKRGYKLERGNFLAYGPKYFTFKEGAKHNKYHVFTVLKLDNGMAIPANSYGRIGYPHAATWLGPTMSESGALAAIRKKIYAKERKGYNLEFGAEGDSSPDASHPTEYDPLTASPSDEGGPPASYGWDAADSDEGAFSAEFIANAEDMYCAECFEAHCAHVPDVPTSGGPSPLDYDPLTASPADEGGPPTGPPAEFEAEHSGVSMAAGVGVVLGLIAAYKYSDKISDLFTKMSDE